MKVLAGTLPLVSAAVAERPLPPPVRVARPAPPPDEATLCERAMTGDRDAWNALVQRHNHRVVVALLARGVRIDRAKDIAQATFLALEAARREVDDRRHDPIDEPAVAAALADPRADAESRLMTAERVARAAEVLAGCSASSRNVFRLAYGGEGLSHAEVAKRVGLSLQRVRQILCEVRAKLRTALLDEEDGDEASGGGARRQAEREEP